MKQLFTYLLAILLWIAAAVMLLKGIVKWLLPALAALHFVELLFTGFSTGKKYGLGAGRSIIMCMLYGFLWWLPLKKRMAEDDLDESAFVEDGLEPWREAFER